MPVTHPREQTTSSFQVWLNKADSKRILLQKHSLTSLATHKPLVGGAKTYVGCVYEESLGGRQHVI